jgi:hypothetical protein
MQDVDCFLKFGDVHHAVDAARVFNANLFSARTHIVERLPVGRLKPGLDLPELEPCFLAEMVNMVSVPFAKGTTS